MNPQQHQKLIQLVQRYRRDFPVFCREQVKIVDKSGKVIPFELNEEQMQLWLEIKRCIDAGKPVRIKILKARRLGFSTMIAALGYWKIWGWKNYSGMIITQDVAASSGILEKSQFINDNIKRQIRPVQKNSNTSELYFNTNDGKGQNSGFSVKTAENPKSLRSHTNQFLHLSEVAFWNKAKECALAALSTVDDESPDTIIIYETTANGVGGYWYDLWYDDNGYSPMFFGWQDHKEYTSQVPADFEPMDDGPYGNEVIEKARLKLTDGQIVWRRGIIKNKCGGSITQFLQEYPGTPEDAFQSTGQCRFNMDGLRHIETYGLLPDPIYTGHVSVIDGNIKVHAVGDKKESILKIWAPYEKRKQYFSTCDISEGITHDDGKSGDASCIKIFELESGELVAEWHGRLEPADVGRVEAYICRAYGACILVQEINNHGHASMVAITQIEKYPKELIFTHTTNKGDQINQTVKLGWLTNSHTRGIMIDDLALAIQNKELFKIPRETLRELYTFTSKKAGNRIKYEAGTGSHDDRVLITAMARHLLINDVFLNRYRLRIEHWQQCHKCKNYKQGVCIKLKSRRDSDDGCRMFELYNAVEKFNQSKEFETL